MKATKNPGKLNTSFWDTAFKDGNKEEKPKQKKGKKKVKKKKSKMANMWENKFEEQKKKVESTSYKPPPKKKVIKVDEDAPNESNETTSPETEQVNGDDANTETSSETQTPSESVTSNGDSGSSNGSTENSSPSKPKASKVSALAGKIAFNPMAMRGGLPPSLRKKREEAKEKGVERMLFCVLCNLSLILHDNDHNYPCTLTIFLWLYCVDINYDIYSS